MRKIIRNMVLLMVLLLSFGTGGSAALTLDYDNSETGFRARIVDQAGILDPSDDDAANLCEQMKQLSAYGNAMLLTVNDNASSADKLAQNTYYDTFGNEEGCLFLIDMDNREIMLASDGKSFRKELNRAAALTISDNVYQYAAAGDYTTCAFMVFVQIKDRLEGGRIAAPMRYLSAFFFAILLALTITYIMAKKESTTELTKERELLNSIIIEKNLYNARRSLIERDITREKSSSSGSGGSGGGGGGGGGGFSGSSGGHGF